MAAKAKGPPAGRALAIGIGGLLYEPVAAASCTIWMNSAR